MPGYSHPSYSHQVWLQDLVHHDSLSNVGVYLLAYNR